MSALRVVIDEQANGGGSVKSFLAWVTTRARMVNAEGILTARQIDLPSVSGFVKGPDIATACVARRTMRWACINRGVDTNSREMAVSALAKIST